ncbi:MAG TPA: SUMF1/EgtB/PvdO family nonheme iron enzyme [Terriglobia bacterium]|nr:SUMF1/EgtB/PvdO family nonheme iron enzyme [Terriglobia bacterium]
MILIPSGWFWMGSEGRYSWESPRHRVFLSGFLIEPTAVTRGDYQKFLEATGHPQPKGWTNPEFAQADQPAVGMSWFDAIAYCEWISAEFGEARRLPTEAEWEKACRGGTDDAEYAWGDESPSSLPYFQGPWTGPRPVRDWTPNPYGLFHMGDNVHEWCSDWFDPDYYARSPQVDPAGPASGTRRVSRGGSWRHLVKASRAAHRSSLPPDFRYTDYGFRLASSLL